MVTAVIGALRVDLSLGTSGWSSGIRDVRRDATGFEAQMQKIGKRMGSIGQTMTSGITAPLLGLGGAVAKFAGDFEKQMNAVGIATQASSAQMKQMNDMALELGKSTVFSASESASAMEMLAKNGVGVTDILNGAAKAAVDLAAATGSQLDPAANAISDTMQQFKMSAKDLPDVINQITGAVNESKLDFIDFQQAAAQAGGVAGSLGVTFADFNAVLAGTSALFGSGSDAGTSFKTFLTTLVPKSTAAATAMEKYGLKFFDAQGKMKSMSAIAQNLQESLSGLSAEARTEVLKDIFGVDAMRTAVGLMDLGAAGLDKIAGKIKATDAAAQSAERMKGFNAQMEQLGGSLETLAIRIGQSGFLAMVTEAVKWIADLVDVMSEASPQTLNFALGVAAVAAALGPILMILSPIVTAVGALVGIFSGWATAVGAAATAAGGFLPLLTPLLPIIAGIAAAAGAAYLVWKNWGTIGPMLQGFGTAIVDALGPSVMNMLTAFKEAAVALWDSISGSDLAEVLSGLGKFQALIVQSLGAAIPGVLKALGAAFSAVFNMIAETVRIIVALFQGDWAGAWTAAGNLVKAFANGVGGIFSGLHTAAMAMMEAMVKGIDAWLGTRLSAVWDGVKKKIEGVAESFRWLWDVVIGHSYIPDLVDGIGANMDRLEALMVKPVKKATKDAADAFKEMAADVAPLLDRLFPDQAKIRQFRDDLALIDKAEKSKLIDAGTAQAARRQLKIEKDGETPVVLNDMSDAKILKPGWDIDKELEKIANGSLPKLKSSVLETNAQMVESFALMAEGVLHSLRGMVASFKGGDILGGLSSLLDIVLQVAPLFGAKGGGGVGLFGGTSYGGARAMGGPVVPGKSYRVGENGPEFFTPTEAGRISPKGGPGGGNTYYFSGNLLTPEFWDEIKKRDDEAAMNGATGGAQIAMDRSNRRASRRL